MSPPLTITCAVCRQSAASSASFCRRCGARLPQPTGGAFRPVAAASERVTAEDER